MKALLGISVAVAIFFSLPVNAQNTNSGMSDDGIYAPSGAPAPAGQPAAPMAKPADQNNTGSHTMVPADQNNGQSYVRPDSNNSNSYTATNNYYSDDYNDYGYSARLRRYDDNW